MGIGYLNFSDQARRWPSLALWLGLVALGVVALALTQRSLQLGELERESAGLHRLASQRVGQHDAHLTALSAIAVAGAGRRPDLFLDVAATISTFYPRIREVQLVPLDPVGHIVGSRPLEPDEAEAIRAAARRSKGLPVLLPHPRHQKHYLLIKRSPNSDKALYALTLSIDAEQLLESDAAFWSRGNAGAGLALPGGGQLAWSSGMAAPQFSRPLESTSQPLQLETSVLVGFGDVLPPVQVALVVAAISLAYFAALATMKQRARTRSAEREAELRRMEAQLTHASRVNAMGEMASGMAHELTQPLTAILAQAQAGRRLLGRSDVDAVDPALEEIGTQARRASDILERLRNWSRPQRGPIGPINLRDVLSNVQTLLASEAERRGVILRVDVPERTVEILADKVEMEQVLHNLVRNAFEALEAQADGEVRVLVDVTQTGVTLDVADNGPGVDASLRSRLFTPFMTTRENGTGLGLALSQRLIERAGGEISYLGDTGGATFRVALPKAGADMEAAQ